MDFQKILLVLVLFQFGCGLGGEAQAPPETAQRKPASDELTSRCLDQYGLPGAILKSESHQFSQDCSLLELPESSLVDHYKVKIEKANPKGQCKQVVSILEQIDGLKTELKVFENKKLAEATDKYDGEIEKISSQVDKLKVEKILARAQAKVFVTPVKRHKLLDELKFLEKRGLSFTLDSSDMSSRELRLKSYLVSDQDQSIRDEASQKIKNLFYCSMADQNTSDQIFFEYMGSFNQRPFVKVFEVVLDN